MKFIANILTDKKLVFDNLYNVVNNKEDLISDIPTLVIGWEYTKNIFPEANILDWEIKRNFYWTYGSREKRNRYEENLIKFKELAVKQFVKSVKYTYINMLTASNEDKQYIMNLIDNVGTTIYSTNDMVYLMDTIENRVIGFSLRDIDYIGKDRKKIFTKIYHNPNNNLISLSNDNISWDMRNVLRNYNYVIPFLFR
jgi:hypothetical protein